MIVMMMLRFSLRVAGISIRKQKILKRKRERREEENGWEKERGKL